MTPARSTELVARALGRYWWRHPLQLLLAVLGITLGVGLVSAVLLAVASSRRAFELSVAALTGPATHHIVGVAEALDERWYAALRIAGVRHIAPYVEGYAQVGGEALQVVGFDVFAERTIRQAWSAAGSTALSALLSEPATVLLTHRTARRLGVRPGEHFTAKFVDHSTVLRVVGYLDAEDHEAVGLEGVLLVDMATAQELLSKVGRLDRIDAVLAGAPEVAAVRERLPPGAQLVDAAARNQATAHMSRAFEINLTAMSLLALLVGAFLIFNTLSFSVLQRRALIADLRMLGATRTEMLRHVLAEAALLGLVGGALGAVVGWFAAHGLLRMITRTINDFYFVLSVTDFQFSPWALLQGLGLGLGGTLLAALGPAYAAAGTSPLQTWRRSSVEHGAQRLAPRLIGWAGVAGVLALLMLRWPAASLLPAIGGLFMLIAAYSLAVPYWLSRISSMLQQPLGRCGGLMARLAVGSAPATLSRTALATVALSVAVAATIGVSLMIGSFQLAISAWLGQLVSADLYLARPARPQHASPPLPNRLVEDALRLPGVVGYNAARRTFVRSDRGVLELLAFQGRDATTPAFRFKGVDDHVVWQRFIDTPGIIVSEPLATHWQLKPGDYLRLTLPDGERRCEILGIFFDYRSNQGIAAMYRPRYQQWFGDAGVTALGLYLAPGADLEVLRGSVSAALAPGEAVLVRSNRDIRAASEALFDRTFAITRVLRLVTVGVALIGMVSALLALELERAREMALLRALGATAGQAARRILWETGWLGLLAGMFAIPLGIVMAWALVKIINLRSFGWSLELSVPAAPLLDALWLSVAAALLAALYPAWRAGRVAPAQALREE